MQEYVILMIIIIGTYYQSNIYHCLCHRWCSDACFIVVGVGRRGGTISHFMLGVPVKEDENDTEPKTWALYFSTSSLFCTCPLSPLPSPLPLSSLLSLYLFFLSLALSLCSVLQSSSFLNMTLKYFCVCSFYSFCKVGSGYSDGELKVLQEMLQGIFISSFLIVIIIVYLTTIPVSHRVIWCHVTTLWHVHIFLQLQSRTRSLARVQNKQPTCLASTARAVQRETGCLHQPFRVCV